MTDFPSGRKQHEWSQMLSTDPGNTSVLFGLAKEYEKAGRDHDLIETLKRYLENFDDQGNATNAVLLSHICAGEFLQQR